MARSNAEAKQAVFNLVQNAAADELTLDVYDFIGDDGWGEGVAAQNVREQLNGFSGKGIAVRINSLGGDVFDGVAIYNLLRDASRRGATVTVDVDGVAASAASIIACAGDVINVAASAVIMIHNAWTFAIGNADELRKSADMLDKIDGQLAVIYQETVKRLGKATKTKQIREAMDDETWLTAAEAVEFGIASNVTKASKAEASAMAVASIAKLPESMLGNWAAMQGRVAACVRSLPTDTTPAQSGPTIEESDMGLKELIEALGAQDEAGALEIAAKVPQLILGAEAAVALHDSVTTLTGEDAPAAALGVLNAWKGNSEQLPAAIEARDAAQAELTTIADKAEQTERSGLLASIQEAGKATRAEAGMLADQPIPFLKAWLQNASTKIPEAGKDPRIVEPASNDVDDLSASDLKVCRAQGMDPKVFAETKRARLAQQPTDDDEG